MNENSAGIIETIINIFIIPNFSAAKPNNEIIIATMPQENPLIKPEIILLYSGSTFCAKSIVTGVASIMKNPVIINIPIDSIGNFSQVNVNSNINGIGSIIDT